MTLRSKVTVKKMHTESFAFFYKVPMRKYFINIVNKKLGEGQKVY